MMKMAINDVINAYSIAVAPELVGDEDVEGLDHDVAPA